VTIAIVVTMLFASHVTPVARGGAMSPSGFETGDSGSVSPNEAVVFRLFNEVFSGTNVAVCVELVAEEAVIHTPNGTYSGHLGMRNFVEGLRASFPDANFNVTDLMTDGDTVVARWVMTGSQDGAFQGNAATGAPVTLNGITILRFAHGIIIEEWVTYDRLHLVQQIEADANTQHPPSEVCPPCSP
jgi:predicted ester cyclase